MICLEKLLGKIFIEVMHFLTNEEEVGFHHICLKKELVIENSFSERLATYREICSLASECNQPDLIYKFLQIASHNATWDSKKVRKGIFKQYKITV